ncbi:DUF1636 family protein [Paracoccus sp. p3-h83]|uniref:DUF1636 family protein n=1 Tax=Paracoccus sp. p3-h83 TaxID=3342805 RepID=UPI0035B8F478
MNHTQRPPSARPAPDVARSAPHRTILCTACTVQGATCAPGLLLLERLRDAVAASGMGDDFEVSGTASLTGCAGCRCGPCLVAWRATAKANWLFGNVDPADSIDDLIALCGADAGGPDTCAATQRLSRIPSAIIVTGRAPLQ